MKKIILLAFLLAMAFAEQLDPGKAYIVSSINVNSSKEIESGQSYSLVPQIVVATGSENYAGSVTPFTGCYEGKRYEGGEERGNCLTGVINSLNSDSEIDALSAAQGKVLNDRTRINYINKVLPSQTLNGIDLTNNGDGTYTVNGTNTSNEETVFWLEDVFIPKGTYKVVGAPNSPYVSIGGNYESYATYQGKTVTKDTDGYYNIGLVIQPNSTVSSFIFKPMVTNDLEATYDDFVPYQDSLTTNQAIIDATRVNYLRPALQTVTAYGVTITNNGNGTYTLNGTATTTFHIGILWNIKLSGQYKLIGCPEGGSEETYRLVLHNTPFSWATVDYGNGTVFNINETCHLQLYINAGVPLNNLVFKPMITNDLSATYDDFVSFDNSLVTGINSGIKMDTLWENASPEASFATQIVNLNTSEYRALIIEYRANAVSNGEYYTEILTTKDLPYLHFGFYNADYWSERYCKWIDTGVNFGNCKKNGTISNDYMIPYRIYGIK